MTGRVIDVKLYLIVLCLALTVHIESGINRMQVVEERHSFHAWVDFVAGRLVTIANYPQEWNLKLTCHMVVPFMSHLLHVVCCYCQRVGRFYKGRTWTILEQKP